MVGRITTMMIAQSTLDDITTSYTRMANTQEELSSGKTINQPSDNPYGMSQVLNLQGQLGSLTTYTNQINDGTAWTTAATSALSNISNMVQRAQELTVEASNGADNQSDLTSIADEVDQLTSGIEQEANTQYNGQYIFSGTAGVEPYQTATGDAYQGNSGAITRSIGPGVTVQVNADLGSVLGNGQTSSSGGDGKLLDTLRQISSDLKSGNVSGLSGDLSSLNTNFNAVTQLSTNVGSVADRLQLASDRIQSLQTDDTEVLSQTQDADMAQAEIDFSTESAAYSAALKAGANIVQNSLVDFLN